MLSAISKEEHSQRNTDYLLREKEAKNIFIAFPLLLIIKIWSLDKNTDKKKKKKKRRKVRVWSDISDIIGPVIRQPGKLITYWSRARVNKMKWINK